ncbi:hypothetical protein [uncultured Wocania sp.]|uniref:hypothetical protein n=1 Tax=uncultured Wocania sp. TaxID=2834404 RepID=UPI0030FA7590
MKLITLLFCVLCFTACKTDDDNGIDCDLFDPANRNLFIELVDGNGNNLIENNTFVADDIKVLFNGNTITNVVFNDVEGIENLIALSLIGEAGNNTFEIQLSSEITDTLILNLKAESQICGWTFFSLNSATYNDVLQTIEDFNGNYIISVIR